MLGSTQRYVFLHIPKCGGTSFHHLLAQHFAPEETCPERLRFLDRMPNDEIVKYRFYSGHYFFDQLERIPNPKNVFTWLREPRRRLLSLYHFFRSHTWEAIQRLRTLGTDDVVGSAKTLDLLPYIRQRDPVTRKYVSNAMTLHLVGERYVDAEGHWLISPDQAYNLAVRNLLGMAGFGVLEHYAQCLYRFQGILPFELPLELPIMNDFDTFPQSAGFERVERCAEFDPETEAELALHTAIDSRVYNWALQNVLP